MKKSENFTSKKAVNDKLVSNVNQSKTSITNTNNKKVKLPPDQRMLIATLKIIYLMQEAKVNSVYFPLKDGFIYYSEQFKTRLLSVDEILSRKNFFICYGIELTREEIQNILEQSFKMGVAVKVTIKKEHKCIYYGI